MAEFLIKAVSAANPDPNQDQGCYKKGDIIAAYQNGTFSEPNANPKFFLVRVPDMDLAEAQSLCAPIMTSGYNVLTGEIEETMLLRRRFFCEENIMPEFLDLFYRCIETGAPFLTNRLDFLSWSVTDKVA